MTSRATIIFLSIIILIGLFVTPSAGAEWLWRYDKDFSAGAAELPATPDVALMREAPARFQVLLPSVDGGGEIDGGFGGGEPLVFERQYLERRTGGLFWVGRASGGERLSLTLEQGRVFAGVETSRGLFSLQPKPFGAPGEHVLETPAAKSRDQLSCGTGAGRSAAYPASAPALTPEELEAEMLERAEKADPQIDVVVFYSPQARAAFGLQGVVGWAQRSMDLNNLAFRTSQMPARVRLVGVRQANFQENTSGIDALVWLSNNQQPRSVRDELGADAVAMLVLNAQDVCGVANVIPRGNFNDYRDRLFQVTRISCIEGHTFSHEMGHLFGMHHDPANAGVSSFPWSYGHFVDGHFRTVLSYRDECELGCVRQPYYSSPLISFEGVPTGIAGARDNRRTGLVTTPIIANFRQPIAGEPPDAPSALEASAPSAFRVELAWSDNSSNENSFQIERTSPDNLAFVPIATLPAETTSFVDDTVEAQATYSYRVRAQNSFGASAYTGTASVTTPAPDTSSCATDDTVVCLLDGRFEVRVGWSDFDGNSGSGRVLDGFSDQSAIFWFFEQENWEMMVKMVDACTYNGHFWIFSAATTNVEYALEVRDTETGREKIYTNPLGTSAAAVTDTSALATCP